MTTTMSKVIEPKVKLDLSQASLRLIRMIGHAESKVPLDQWSSLINNIKSSENVKSDQPDLRSSWINNFDIQKKKKKKTQTSGDIFTMNPTIQETSKWEWWLVYFNQAKTHCNQQGDTRKEQKKVKSTLRSNGCNPAFET
jgi:hypothetical protein